MEPFKQNLQVRWADLDPNGHVRHSVYYDYGAQIRRAYADDGRGVAIGFGENDLSRHIKEESTSLVDCIYKEHSQFIENIKNCFADDLAEILNMCETTKDVALNAPGSIMDVINENSIPLEKIFCQLLRIKNDAFFEEQEVRLIITNLAKGAKTRTSNGLIIPYVEHNLFPYDDPRECFSYVVPEIWLGPKCDERNFHALSALGQLGWTAGHGLFRYDCGYI